VIERDENAFLTKSEIKMLQRQTSHAAHTQFSEQNTINNHSRVESNETVLLKQRLHGPDISHTSKAKQYIHIFMIHMHYSHQRPFHVVHLRP